jgi:hypothetical protein
MLDQTPLMKGYDDLYRKSDQENSATVELLTISSLLIILLRQSKFIIFFESFVSRKQPLAKTKLCVRNRIENYVLRDHLDS